MNKIKNSIALLLLFSSGHIFAAAGCIGQVSKVWVEQDDALYFNIKPSNECVCNFSEGIAKGFSVPADQVNKEEQYSALLAAFMADIDVMSWFDWRVEDGSQRCISWNISLSK
ncbi:hypothetical protein [Photobacterium galatheae]|uniref:Lipoprotein n=1 Tax=Photobacterium galatheae TaxID=1654360 RepID=A0A066RRJ2_9GAMM|nr:hypothetical protein [Photobacterium galatheae]KDM91706.1 hypothetical protein EA58_10065 [Photobacterium galatheae]MCM0149817.1 hypothetical protein [Photobacterium galatheae]